MKRRQEYRLALRAMADEERGSFLDAHSGLPGPRANLELMQAAADEGTAAWFEGLAASEDEFRAATGAVGLGRLLADRPDEMTVASLRTLATDGRWRVREGVAMALQRLGDDDPERLWSLARAWGSAADPFVQRAAVAGVCEPRLLRTSEAAGVALEVCEAATTALAARPSEERRREDVRTLRQALGYCWSVAVAAEPTVGVPRFLGLAKLADPDVDWIVRENSKKVRLVQVLDSVGEPAPAAPW